jgi:predicted O-methyltransferase YrrM
MFVSVDLPGGEFGGGYPPQRMALYRTFAPDRQMEFIRRNSHDRQTKTDVEAALPSGSVDFLFIDADHTYEGVKQDFEMYAPLVRTGGAVVFHDISGNPNDPDVGVDRYWQELDDEYDTTEIVGTDDQQWGGFGIVRL